jgi:hypothetical protein
MLVAAGLALPVVASAQTTTYLCTPDGQVLKQAVNANGSSGGTTIWYTGNKKEAFDDCVVGPDGWLYISSGASILRLKLDAATPNGTAPVLAVLGSAARGIAFNVNTLYINTAASGIVAMTGVPAGSGPLTFSSANALLSVSPSDGHGIAFDVLGNLVLTSGTQVLRAAVNLAEPFYSTSPSSLLTRPATVFGTAVNTCGQIVYADKNTRSVRSRSKDGLSSTTLATFQNALDYPVAVEIDSNNNMYVVTAQSDTGSIAKLWLVPGSLANGCAAAGVLQTPIVELSTLLSGTNKLKGLLSDRALGVAVAVTHASIARTFNSATPLCSNLYDFGYHTLRLTFADCSQPFSVTVDALKSKPSEVSFSGEIDPAVEGLRYSPMGGYIVQYVLNNPGPASPTLDPFPYNAEYRYAAQETLGTPGVARAQAHGLTATFTENTIQDFWDIGVLDPFAGDRGNDFSKRVLFNAPLATSSTTCTIALADWDQPFNSQNPLFKQGQAIKIAFTARDSITGAPCGGGGTMRLSVLRTSPTPLVLQQTQSVGGAQTGNVMDNQGDKYSFNLETSGFGIGTFQVTVWGDKIAPTTRTFSIGQ